MTRGDEHLDTEAVLHAYFEELDAALSDLPRARRRQLADEIRLHVNEALAEQPPGSPIELRNLLDRVGLPEDIAAAALDEESLQPRRPGRTWQVALFAGIAVALAGAGAGLGLALSSSDPPSAAAGTPTAHGTTVPAKAPTGSPTSATVQPPASQLSATPSTPPPSPSASAPALAQATTGAPPSTSASASTGAPAGLAILAPATVQPVSAECTEQVTYDADGNVSPLTCTNDGVNTIAWQDFADGQSGTTPNGSELLRLGRYASPTQVYQAMCYDFTNVYKTKPITESAEEIAQAYYGWQFAGGSPVSEFEIDGCQAQS
ncbi:MAG TPA: hypothetical protein VI365_21060 [Trebonia sp.]